MLKKVNHNSVQCVPTIKILSCLCQSLMGGSVADVDDPTQKCTGAPNSTNDSKKVGVSAVNHG
jgi:hypothetical protein